MALEKKKSRNCISDIILPIALVPVMLLLFVSVGNATISVETFTCSGMSGTVVVENSAAFSCQASLKNEDTQNSANIGSVSLLVDGSWAEKTSYTGTDFSASVSAGASTTATFSGLKAVTPGATNKFQSIQIDSASDTTVTNTNVNVIVIKSLTVSASSSSVAQGSEFDITATMVAGGDLGSATLTWSGSGGCALSSGHSAAKDVGSLSHNAEGTRGWRIVQGSAECTNTVTASGASSSVTTTKSKSTAVSVAAGGTTPPTGSSSGGGGGGGGAAASGETKTAKEINVGVPAVLAFAKFSVESVVIDVNSKAANVAVTVNEISSPATPIENAYKYLDIKAVNITDSNIKSAKISFRVGKEWLTGKDKNSVRLNRYQSGWSELPTVMDSENSTDVRYTAETPGFSLFAITTKQPEAAAQQPRSQPQPQPSQPVEQPVPERQETTNIGGIEVPKAVADYSIIIITLVFIIVAALGWFHYHSPWKQKAHYEYKPKK